MGNFSAGSNWVSFCTMVILAHFFNLKYTQHNAAFLTFDLKFPFGQNRIFSPYKLEQNSKIPYLYGQIRSSGSTGGRQHPLQILYC